MLIRSNKLIPFLAHRDGIVRRRMADYLLQHNVKDYLIVEMSFKALFGFGLKNNLSILYLLENQFLQIEDLKKLYLLWLEAKKEGLFQSLEQIQSIFLAQEEAFLKENKHYFSTDFIEGLGEIKWKEYLQPLSILEEKTEEVLWDELHVFIQRNQKSLGKIDVFEGQLIIDALKSKYTGRYHGDIKYFLKNATKSKSILKAFFYVLLVDSLKLKDLVPFLFNFYKDEAFEMLFSEISFTIASFNDETFLTDAFTNYQKAPSFSKEAFASIFGFFASEKSESFLLNLYKKEKKLENQLSLCLSLEDIFSTHFIPKALDLVEKGYNRSVIVLEEELLVYAAVTGEVITELGEFASEYFERKNKKKKVAKRINQLNPSKKTSFLLEQDLLHYSSRVYTGRNKLCLCGSGKKYKNCCMF